MFLPEKGVAEWHLILHVEPRKEPFQSQLERIYAALGLTKEQLFIDIAAGFMLSVDVAHGLHPNYADKTDPTNRPLLNGGLVIKQASTGEILEPSL